MERGEKGGVKNWIKFADEYVLKNWDGCIKNILWVALVLSTKTYSMHVIKLKDKSMAMQDNEKCTTAWQRDGKANNASLS